MDYFHEAYRDYLAQNPKKKLKFYLDTIQKNTSYKSIFEIGVGQGLFLEYASRRGFKVGGCDINPDAIREAKEHVPISLLFESRFEDVPVINFQIIVAFDALEHL